MADGEQAAGLGRRRGAGFGQPVGARACASASAGRTAQRGTFSQRHAVLHDSYDGHTLHAAAASGARSGAGRNLQQPAVGSRRAGLRIRLQPRLPRRAGDVGSAVRRLLQRGAGDHRSVHRQRRGQMEPAQRAGAAVAARLRRAGARSIPAPGWSGFCRWRPKDNIQVVNPTTPAQFFHCLRRQVLRVLAQAAGRDDAQEPAAASEGRFDAGRTAPREVFSA